MPISKVQQNFKVRSLNQHHPQLQAKKDQPKQCIERNFLKENMEYVKLKSINVQRIKFTSSCQIEPLTTPTTITTTTTNPTNSQIQSTNKQQLKFYNNINEYNSSGKGDAPRSVFERLKAGAYGSRGPVIPSTKRLIGGGLINDSKLISQKQHHQLNINNNKQFLSGSSGSRGVGIKQQHQQQQQLNKNEIKSNDLDISEKKMDQMVQTFDNLDDKLFTEDAIIMEPTLSTLKKIRDDREKLLQEQLKEKLLERRKFGKESAKLETHLSDLSEFLDTGSVSRRKINKEKNEQKLRNVIYDRSFLKNLTSTSISKNIPITKNTDANKINNNNNNNNSKSNSKINKKNTATMEKVSKIPLRTEYNKINNNVGDGPIIKSNNDDNKLVVLYQRYKKR